MKSIFLYPLALQLSLTTLLAEDSPLPNPDSQNHGTVADAVRPSATPVAATILLEGKFGRVEVNTQEPSLTSLTLRRADGALEPQSLLAPQGVPVQRGLVPAWATQALTYAADETGRRFESRNRPPESVARTDDGVTLRGVVLSDGAGEPVAREDWVLRTKGNDLVWTVERTWLRELTTTSTGTPALFFSNRPINNTPSTVLPNAVTTTFWIAPDKLRGWHNPLYRPAAQAFDYKLALENNLVVTEPGGWAVLKLFPAWQHEREPRFAAAGGHLYRRGHFGWLSEAGIVSHPEAKRIYKAGEKEKTTLRLRAVPAAASGHQLAVQAEDPSGTIATLRSWYGALLNGGCVNDQVHYNFGNEPDGWYYGGASWMKGLPLLAGAPASDAASSRPLELPHAFRDNLQMLIGTEFEPGRTRFGYNAQGAYTDDNIIQVIGARAYYLYSGDLAFVRQNLPFYRRAVAWYLGKRNTDGLFSLTPAHWYYDAMTASGVTTYHNAFLYRALIDLADLERAAGNTKEAAGCEAEAAELKEAINRVLWWEDAPGGPRYVDWITPDGTKIAYGADLCQFPPVAFGIASPEQGKKLIATFDKRIAELERDHGYAGYASRSAYWPVPASVNTHPANQGFGNYMNGGSFLCMTYWEIMARAAAGDAEGAWKRLQKFAEGTRLTGEKGFIGNNWVMQDGRIGSGACDEPFLADAIAVPAALVQGILGIRQTNDKLEVNPVLPAALQKVSAEVVHLGRRKRVTIAGKNVKIEELGRAFTPPGELTWRLNAGSPPAAALYIDRTFEAGSGWTATPEISLRVGEGVALRRVSTSPLMGLWKLDDAPGDTVANGSEYAASGRLAGKVGLQSPDRHGIPAAARFQGGASVTVDNLDPFVFKPADSFTLQAWFQTGSSENQVIAARPGAYSLGVKAGKLSAWIMQDGGQFVEAAGATAAADGQWHHAAAVYDREAQILTLHLDGKPDGVPPSIAGIGASASQALLTLGSFGGGFPFDGVLDEVSIQRAALAPAEFSFTAEYAATPPLQLGALTGTYTTAPCDWGQPVRHTALRTTATLNDGTIKVQIETSDDAFKTIAATLRIDLRDGEQTSRLTKLKPAHFVRVVCTLTTPAAAERSPVLAEVELIGEPAVPLLSQRAARRWPASAVPQPIKDGPFEGLYREGPPGDVSALRVDSDAESGALVHLGVDTEGGGRERMNLLREPAAVSCGMTPNQRTLAAGKVVASAPGQTKVDYAGTALEWQAGVPDGGLTLTVTAPAQSKDEVELWLPFRPALSAVTVLGGQWDRDGTVRPPFLLNAPDLGLVLNGGCCVSDTFHFLVASHMAGLGDRADRMLAAMLQRQWAGVHENGGGFQNGIGGGGEFYTWDGTPCGYEGHLTYSYTFLQTVLLREPAFRLGLYGDLYD